MDQAIQTTLIVLIVVSVGLASFTAWYSYYYLPSSRSASEANIESEFSLISRQLLAQGGTFSLGFPFEVVPVYDHVNVTVMAGASEISYLLPLAALLANSSANFGYNKSAISNIYPGYALNSSDYASVFQVKETGYSTVVLRTQTSIVYNVSTYLGVKKFSVTIRTVVFRADARFGQGSLTLSLNRTIVSPEVTRFVSSAYSSGHPPMILVDGQTVVKEGGIQGTYVVGVTLEQLVYYVQPAG